MRLLLIAVLALGACYRSGGLPCQPRHPAQAPPSGDATRRCSA